MNKILVPTDFSETAQKAIDSAAIIARKSGASITLLNVIEGPTPTSFNVEGEADVKASIDDLFVIKLVPIVKKQLETISSSEGYSDLTIDYQVEIGNAYKTIVDKVKDYDCDLIVMGTQGSSGLDEWLIGSNTEKVARITKHPLLAVKNVINENSFDNIVVGVNFEEDNSKLMEVVKTFQSVFGSKLHLVRIDTPTILSSDTETLTKLDSIALENSLENYTTHVFNAVESGTGLFMFTQQINASCIAIGTHGKRGVSHFFIGSATDDVINRANWPVITQNLL